jgi:hypothetical protein
MAQTVKLKRSSQEGNQPETTQLELGELAINTYDGLLYIKKDDGTPTVIRVNDRNTDDLTEGSTNVYFTDARARSAISASGDISYNSTTGVISYTAPTALSDFTNDMWEVTSTEPTDGTGKPAGYVWYIV